MTTHPSAEKMKDNEKDAEKNKNNYRAAVGIELAELVRLHKMRCSYTHHQMRDLLAISPLHPYTLYTLSRGNIVSYNLLTHKVRH